MQKVKVRLDNGEEHIVHHEQEKPFPELVAYSQGAESCPTSDGGNVVITKINYWKIMEE